MKRAFVLLLCACKKVAAVADAGSNWELQPMAEPAVVDAAAPPLTPPPAPWAMGYSDSDDLPDAGAAASGRCSDSANKKIAVSVYLEHVANPAPTVDLVIPSLKVRRRLWADWPRGKVENPYSCHTTFDSQGLKWSCSEVMTSAGGKIYARGSDIIAGKKDYSGKLTVDRFELPCDRVARFETIVCPSRCKAFEGGTSCDCSELDSDFHKVRPASTASAR